MLTIPNCFSLEIKPLLISFSSVILLSLLGSSQCAYISPRNPEASKCPHIKLMRGKSSFVECLEFLLNDSHRRMQEDLLAMLNFSVQKMPFQRSRDQMQTMKIITSTKASVLSPWPRVVQTSLWCFIS